jgi:hypothetical protein
MTGRKMPLTVGTWNVHGVVRYYREIPYSDFSKYLGSDHSRRQPTPVLSRPLRQVR